MCNLYLVLKFEVLEMMDVVVNLDCRLKRFNITMETNL